VCRHAQAKDDDQRGHLEEVTELDGVAEHQRDYFEDQQLAAGQHDHQCDGARATNRRPSGGPHVPHDPLFAPQHEFEDDFE
jgi:hypothetical protein